MEAVVVPRKEIKTPKRNTNCRSESSGNVHDGLSFNPPPHLMSPLPYSYLLCPQIHRQPPILQTPVHRPSLPSRTRDFTLLSPPKPARKAIKLRDQSLTPKKSIFPGRNKDPKQDSMSPASIASDELHNASLAYVQGLRPFSRRVLSPSPSSSPFIGKDSGSVSMKKLQKSSDSVFTLSPHPNTLPLPKFSIRSKRTCCNVEAGGIDAGATDNLRRILRLPCGQ